MIKILTLLNNFWWKIFSIKNLFLLIMKSFHWNSSIPGTNYQTLTQIYRWLIFYSLILKMVWFEYYFKIYQFLFLVKIFLNNLYKYNTDLSIIARSYQLALDGYSCSIALLYSVILTLWFFLFHIIVIDIDVIIMPSLISWVLMNVVKVFLNQEKMNIQLQREIQITSWSCYIKFENILNRCSV